MQQLYPDLQVSGRSDKINPGYEISVSLIASILSERNDIYGDTRTEIGESGRRSDNLAPPKIVKIIRSQYQCKDCKDCKLSKIGCN
jgi:hypothetical protein